MESIRFTELMSGYFKKHARPHDHYLGIEFEHFLVDRKSLKSYAYFEPNGQKDIVKRLIKSGWNTIVEEDNNPLGIERDGSTITFEPGGQFEISLKPLKKLEEIHRTYRNIIDDIYQLLSPDQALVSLNYHPRTRISELPILPKKRYRMMYDYFMAKGGMSHYMMKGTAATQVSIDYSDEADFIKKFRVANFISPVLSYLFDSTVIFEGELYPGENLRVLIWNNTDKDRSKMVPGSLDKAFGFRDYAQYLLNTPPIFLRKGKNEIFTGADKLRDIMVNHEFDEKDLEHVLSMVFPDIRLKKFIEMRPADSLPYPFGFAVAGIAKAIFCSQGLLDELYERSLFYKDSWVKKQNSGLAKIPPEIDESFLNLKEFIINQSEKALNRHEHKYLSLFMDKIREHGSISRWLKKLYKRDIKEFLRAVEVCAGKQGESND